MGRPNVLLVVLDSVRARNTSLHDHVNDTTPFLRSFASEGATVYEQARAPGVWSLPSHTSLFTGHDIEEHRLVDRKSRLDPAESVWTRLSDDGYETGLFTSNPYLTELPLGLGTGFDHVRGNEDLPYPDALNPRTFVHEHGTGKFGKYVRACLASNAPLRSLLNGISEKLEQDSPVLNRCIPKSPSTAELFTDRFLEWQSGRGGPWAACINFMDAHTPYTPGPDHDRWGGTDLVELQAEMENQVWEFYGSQRPYWQLAGMEALYDGAIHRIDAQVRRLVQTLADRDQLDETLLVVTSDHGEGFGETSTVRPGERVVGHHARGIDETLLHVPLVVKYPGQEAPATVEGVATLTRFPSVVESVLDGTWDRAEFCPDGPVIATSFGLDAQKREVASQYTDSIDRFTETGRVLYEDDGDAVRKYATWGDAEAVVQCYDAQTCRVVDRDTADRVNDYFDELGERDVCESADADDVGEETKSRLEHLGYA